jgi:hypothetical protein
VVGFQYSTFADPAALSHNVGIGKLPGAENTERAAAVALPVREKAAREGFTRIGPNGSMVPYAEG